LLAPQLCGGNRHVNNPALFEDVREDGPLGLTVFALLAQFL